jgi:hypothetical protein
MLESVLGYIESVKKHSIRGEMSGYGREITAFRPTEFDDELLAHVTRLAQDKAKTEKRFTFWT